MLNSIRFHALASFLGQSEARNRKPTRRGQGNFGDPCCVETVSAAEGMHGMFGDGMTGRWSGVNQGSGAGNSDGVHDLNRFEEPCPEADRASVGAQKRGNARGAKGGRGVEEAEAANWINKGWRSAPKGLIASGTNVHPAKRGSSLPLNIRRKVKAALSDNTFIQRSDGRSQELSWSITWRAGCEKSASPVREGGRRIKLSPLPHSQPGSERGTSAGPGKCAKGAKRQRCATTCDKGEIRWKDCQWMVNGFGKICFSFWDGPRYSGGLWSLPLAKS
jgi:hypothetical protein